MDNPLVSIIIPVYNSASFLAETIQTVIDQTWPNKELLIIDDGSTDNSLAIAEQFNYPWIKTYSQPNSGAPVARNLGLKYAQGDYIQFLDADDLLSPNKIELQVMALIDNQDKIAVCDTIHFNVGENFLENKPSPYEEKFLFSTDSPTEFLINLWGGNDDQGSMIQTNAWLTPKSIIEQAGSWEEFYSPDDDGEYFTRIILASKGIIYVKDCYNYYRKIQNGLANRQSYKAIHGCYRSVLLKQQSLLQHSQTKEAKFAVARQLMSLAIESYPRYAALTKEIVAKVNDLGVYDYKPIISSLKIRKIASFIGWKPARLVEYLLNKVRKIA